MMPRRVAMLLAALGPVLAAAAECGEAPGAPGARVESARYTVVYRTDPAPIAVGRAFDVEAHVFTKNSAPRPAGLRVDAHMPAHRHGMNYRATVVPTGDGGFRAEGLLFHMPGRWQLVFDIDAPGAHERITQDILIE
jgi:hypothetical protein